MVSFAAASAGHSVLCLAAAADFFAYDIGLDIVSGTDDLLTLSNSGVRRLGRMLQFLYHADGVLYRSLPQS